ncbi:hypothetical protein J2X05_003935 [Cellvibrio fibrivorans]|uniref:Lipoprotein n=1 Tax=Cellvibrio fibrivorans TaxID=126350 RepID=A0ABU1V3D9_9GAMM|nr:hypothetical protein [Cellvibrio fibrivorans]
MLLKGLSNFIQVVSILMMLAGCSSFTCDELSDENKIITKSDLSTVEK